MFIALSGAESSKLFGEIRNNNGQMAWVIYPVVTSQCFQLGGLTMAKWLLAD